MLLHIFVILDNLYGDGVCGTAVVLGAIFSATFSAIESVTLSDILLFLSLNSFGISLLPIFEFLNWILNMKLSITSSMYDIIR